MRRLESNILYLPFFHCSFPEFVASEHVAFLVDEGGPEELEGVDSFLPRNEIPIPDQELDDVNVAGHGRGKKWGHSWKENEI